MIQQADVFDFYNAIINAVDSGMKFLDEKL
jgi:hypothetical protein